MTCELRNHKFVYLASIGVAMVMGCTEPSATAPADGSRMRATQGRANALTEEIATLRAAAANPTLRSRVAIGIGSNSHATIENLIGVLQAAQSPSSLSGTGLHSEAVDSSIFFFQVDVANGTATVAGVSQIWGSAPANGPRWITYVGQTLCYSNCDVSNMGSLVVKGDAYLDSKLLTEFSNTSAPPAANARDSVFELVPHPEKVTNDHWANPYGETHYCGATTTSGSL